MMSIGLTGYQSRPVGADGESVGNWAACPRSDHLVSVRCGLRLLPCFAIVGGIACGDAPDEPQEQFVPLPLAAVSAGTYATCGLGTDGVAYCWGNGRHGQLGFAASEDCSSVPGEDPCAHVPTPVAASLRFTALTTGDVHACGIATDGSAHCWGGDEWGQVGDVGPKDTCGLLATPCTPTPRLVNLGGPLTALSAGGSHTCAVHAAGYGYCWGYGHAGRLGTGLTDNAELPQSIVGGLRFTSIVAGGAHTCGLVQDGTAYCWGYNHLGQLGDGSTASHSTPTPVATTDRFTLLTAGTAHTCGITTTGATLCWGNAGDGALGSDGATETCAGYPCRTTPQRVAPDPGFTTLSAGLDFACGVAGGTSYCWGAIPGVTQPVPIPTRFGTLGLSADGLPFVSVSAGFDHACGIVADASAYCWGVDRHGKLGHGELVTDTLPVLVRVRTQADGA